MKKMFVRLPNVSSNATVRNFILIHSQYPPPPPTFTLTHVF